MDKVRRGRIGLVVLVMIFALPAVIAKLFLINHWYQPGVTNLGELIEPRVTLAQLGQSEPDVTNWQLVYVMPALCDSSCEEALHLLNQSHIALGKYQDRVSTVVWSSSELNSSAPSQYTSILSPKASAFVNEGELIIIDPLGQLVMRYRTNDDVSNALRSKFVLRDFKKLLKLSRVG